jgi:hypothetical protein
MFSMARENIEMIRVSLLLGSQSSQSTPTTPEHLQSWVAALIIYSTVHHLSLTEASKSSRDSNPSSSTDVLSLIIVRMLSCELAGTLAFDQPMANISHRLVALVSYLGQSRDLLHGIQPSTPRFIHLPRHPPPVRYSHSRPVLLMKHVPVDTATPIHRHQ